jgi:hypothetical protein
MPVNIDLDKRKCNGCTDKNAKIVATPSPGPELNGASYVYCMASIMNSERTPMCYQAVE